jgi:hypothetical protein
MEKKQKERLLIRDLMKENEANRQRKQKAKKNQEVEELKQMQEYNALIERQERDREAELSLRVERQKLLIKRMEENVTSKINEKANDDNIRALKQLAERDARAIETEEFKKTRLSVLHSQMRETLRKQVEEKEARKLEEEGMRDLHAQILRLDSHEFAKSEEERKTLRKKLITAYKQQLDAQMTSLEVRRKADKNVMSQNEVLINRELISVVEKALSDKRSA